MTTIHAKSRIPLILGTMTFADPDTSGARISDRHLVQKLINSFKNFGHTELDTARLYGDGTTEKLLSELDLKGLTLDSKCYPVKPGDHSPKQLRESLENSLRTLQVKKLRVFYLHAPDRSVPFEETLKECHNLYQEGKFEQLGLSNFAAWEVALVWGICEKNGFVKPTIYQGMYNAITRSIEDELFPCCRSLGIRIVVYNPLAGGFFAGKISKPDSVIEKGARFDPDHRLGKMYRDRYLKKSYFEALELIQTAQKKYPDLDLLSIGARWLQHHSALTSKDGIIFGVSSLEQIEINCKNSEGGPLPDDILKVLDLAWQTVKAECPPYWR